MNLKQITIYILILGSFSSMVGCFEAPNFPDTPRIAFENVEFKQGSSIFDSLIISIHYEDGDGDLGIDDSFNDAIYEDGSYYTFNGEDPINIKDIGKPFTLEGFTEIPPYERPYTCVNWIETPTINGITVQDTLFYIPNKDHFNIFVKFLFREKGASADVPFQEFNWITDVDPQTCGSPIDGRFPVLKDASQSSAPIEGVLRYGYVSVGLIDLFEDREMKLEVTIQDRKLQKSNTVIITGNKSSDNGISFTLAGIQVN